MAKALLAITAGYSLSPKAIVADALFECSSKEMVLVRDIEINSMCEHHMLPFFGRAHIAYLPEGRVVGLSKLARLADCFAKRLQIQERLTTQLADAVAECVAARGVAVVVECRWVTVAMMMHNFAQCPLYVHCHLPFHRYIMCRFCFAAATCACQCAACRSPARQP